MLIAAVQTGVGFKVHTHARTHANTHTQSTAETLHSAQPDSEYSHQAVTEVKMTGEKKGFAGLAAPT